MWMLHKDKIENVLRLHQLHKDFATIFDLEISQILMLLKLLPFRQGRNSNRLSFTHAIEKIIVFAQVGSFFRIFFDFIQIFILITFC